MDCPHCHADLPPITDPTLRTIHCPACARDVDLADAMEGTSEIVPTDPDPLIGRTLGGGRFRVDSLLGRGGMGTVYRGTQVSLDRIVAIKVLAPELTADATFIRRFRREAGTLAAIEHPNIVTIHDTGAENEIHYIVMAHVAGPGGMPLSLRDHMARGPIDVALALRIATQVGEGLHHAHGHGVVHRDIKPGNILLDARHEAHVADFGIARVAGGAAGDSTLTTTGSSMGTLRYMSPEQKVDATTADARSDVYALGAVLYEMLVGTPPEGRFDLPSQIRPGLDPRIDAIVAKALRPDPDRRYRTAGDMVADLEALGRDTATPLPVAPLPAPPVVAPPMPTPPPGPPGIPPPPTPGATPLPEVTASATGLVPRSGPRIPLWIPAIGGAIVLIVVIGLLVGDGDGNGAGGGTGGGGGGGSDPELAARRGRELRDMLMRKSPPVHRWFDARWAEIGSHGDPAARARAEAVLLAMFHMFREDATGAAVDHEPPLLRGDPGGLQREYWGVQFAEPRLERTILFDADLALIQFSYQGQGRHYVLAVCMRVDPIWFCRVYTGTDRPGHDLYPAGSTPRPEPRGKPDPLASAIGSLAHQMRLLSTGQGAALRECFVPEVRHLMPDPMVLRAGPVMRRTAFADLVQHVSWSADARRPGAQVAMRNGRTLTEMRLVDGRWYSASVWFR